MTILFNHQVKRLEEQAANPVTTQSLLEKDSAVFNHSTTSKANAAPSTVSKPPQDGAPVSPSSPRSPQRASRKRGAGGAAAQGGNAKRRKDSSDGLNSNSNNGNGHSAESPLKRFGQWIKDKVSTP